MHFILQNKVCECAWNCGELVKPGNRFIQGHHQRGQKQSDKQKEIARENGLKNIGRKHTEEDIEKQILAQTGTKRSEATKEKQRLAHLGKKKSLEHIANNKEAQRQPKANINRRKNVLNLLREGKFGWHITRHSIGESYPEKYFRTFLERMGAIKGQDFFQEYRVGIYSLDFAFIDEQGKRDIEIDGQQHLTPERIERDKIRDEYLTIQGWQIFRIPVKDLKRFLKPLWMNR